MTDKRSAAIATLWRAGDLRYLLKRQPSMMEAHDAFLSDKTRAMGRMWYWNISRQFGKSYSLCVLALEECLRTRQAQVKYCAQDQKNARSIVFPQMERLLEDCPPDLRPQFRSQDGIYYFPHNGSRITIAGADRDNIRKLRGQQAHLALVDEGGFVADLEQVVLNVLLPQTTTTQGRLIIGTTPPDSAGHYSAHLAQLCKSRGAYAKFDIWENKLLSEDDKQEILREYGGQTSTRFRREYLCEFVTDSANAVVPEWNDAAEAECVMDIQRPEYFDAYTTMDGGFRDSTGVLFGHADYLQQLLVIEDEWMAPGQLSSDIAREVGSRESALWGGTPCLWTDREKKYRITDARHVRTMDVDPRLAAEFLHTHGMQWNTIEKVQVNGDRFLQASVAAVNDAIRQRRLVIKPNCKTLIRQLHNATWDTSRRKFKRDPIDFHFDLVAALVYKLRVVDFTHNPFPPEKRALDKTFYTENALGPSRTESEDALLATFGTTHHRDN